MCNIQSVYILPQNDLKRIFKFQVSTLYRVGGGRTVRKFRKGCSFLRGNPEMTEIYECCITVTRTFVHDGSTIAIVLYTCDTA